MDIPPFHRLLAEQQHWAQNDTNMFGKRMYANATELM